MAMAPGHSAASLASPSSSVPPPCSAESTLRGLVPLPENLISPPILPLARELPANACRVAPARLTWPLTSTPAGALSMRKLALQAHPGTCPHRFTPLCAFERDSEPTKRPMPSATVIAAVRRCSLEAVETAASNGSHATVSAGPRFGSRGAGTAELVEPGSALATASSSHEACLDAARSPADTTESARHLAAGNIEPSLSITELRSAVNLSVPSLSSH